MQERKYFERVDVEMKKSQGSLNPGSAWEMSELIYRSRIPNTSKKDVLMVEEYMERFGITDSLAQQLLEVREKVVSKHMPGNNLRLSGVGEMKEFCFSLKI